MDVTLVTLVGVFWFEIPFQGSVAGLGVVFLGLSIIRFRGRLA